MKPFLLAAIPSSVLSLLVLTAELSVAAETRPDDTRSACESEERVVWSCTAGSRIYSLCTANEQPSKSSYMLYRVNTPAKSELTFPETRRPAAEVFQFRLLNRVAVVQFENDGYKYSIYESVSGKADIEVVKAGKKVAGIECDESTDTLTLTATMEELEAMGVYR